MFTRLLPSRKQALREACEDRDAEALERLCHGLKGSSRSIGATTLADQCERYETLAAAGRLPSESDLEELCDIADSTARALTRRLAGLGAAGSRSSVA